MAGQAAYDVIDELHPLRCSSGIFQTPVHVVNCSHVSSRQDHIRLPEVSGRVNDRRWDVVIYCTTNLPCDQ